MTSLRERYQTFRELHASGKLLVLANASDAGTARLIESCGATAIATTSAGLAWSHGYPDGNALPIGILSAAVEEIVRAINVPLSVDMEGGYSDDPRIVAENVAAVVEAGGIGINLEDGTDDPELLCEKIAAAKAAAKRVGGEVFINARTDVFLRTLVPAERAVAETISRCKRFHAAGCDSLFVPGLVAPDDITKVVQAFELPINVLLWANLPSMAELRRLGVRRLSVGASLTRLAYGTIRDAATQLLTDERYDALLGGTMNAGELNQLMSQA